MDDDEQPNGLSFDVEGPPRPQEGQAPNRTRVESSTGRHGPGNAPPGPLALIVSDSHLRRLAWAGRVALRGDSAAALLEAAFNVSALGLADRVALILFSGDVFDSPAAGGLDLMAAKSFLESFPAAESLHVQGQHDFNQDHSIMSALGSTHAVGLVEAAGIRVHGMDWTRGFRTALASVGPCDVLLCHQAFEETLGFDGAAQAALADLPAHVRLTVCGDIHSRSWLEAPGGRFLSPGATHRVNMGDSPDFGVCILPLADLSAEPFVVRSKGRPCVRLDLRGMAEDEAAVAVAEAAATAKGPPLRATGGIPLRPLVEVLMESAAPPLPELRGVLVREMRQSSSPGEERAVSVHCWESDPLGELDKLAASWPDPLSAALARRLVQGIKPARELLQEVLDEV